MKDQHANDTTPSFRFRAKPNKACNRTRQAPSDNLYSCFKSRAHFSKTDIDRNCLVLLQMVEKWVKRENSNVMLYNKTMTKSLMPHGRYLSFAPPPYHESLPLFPKIFLFTFYHESFLFPFPFPLFSKILPARCPSFHETFPPPFPLPMNSSLPLFP
eukprot:GHVT01005934.1.p1 GENE.GHVT01005934.1~~GHVT01005934.1.p1  ORF type:complete len:157 (+),score=7.41 GHVT01005934.1:395-865(+)